MQEPSNPISNPEVCWRNKNQNGLYIKYALDLNKEK